MNQIQPPKIVIRFLQWFCPTELYEGIEGDLLEQFEDDCNQYGGRQARRRFTASVVRFFLSGIFMRNSFVPSFINTLMLKSYLVLGVRNIMKRRLYSFINAFGLSIGISFCILIYLFIKDENSFDRFHVNAGRLYQMALTTYDREKYEKGNPSPYSSSAWLPARAGEVMLDELAEVEQMTRFVDGNEGVMRYGEKMFSTQFTLVDSGFFKMFSFPLIEGSNKNIFRKTSEIVLTRPVAERLFGNEDPIGKTVLLDHGAGSYTVIAVAEVPPANSSVDFKVLVPIESDQFLARSREQWNNCSFPTFIQLHEKANVPLFKTHLNAILQKYRGKDFQMWRERDKIPKEVTIQEFNFVPLTDVHLNTHISWTKSSDPRYSMILGGIAILIMLIACINYISLALTTSVSRRIEVGVRKVIGAQRNQLIYQFGLESLILGTISMIVGIGMVFLFLPAFNRFTDKEILLTIDSLGPLIGFSLLLTFVVGIIAGSYPSFFISRFLPSQVLKGGFTSRVNAGFTKPLVVLQFALSAFLIISATIMYRQMEYITNKDLGYDQEQVIVINAQSGWSAVSDQTIRQFRNKAMSSPSVADVAGTSISFNRGWSRYGYQINGEHKAAYVYNVDANYISVLGIALSAGRNFDPAIASDSTGIIVNEAFVRDMKWTDPMSERLNLWEEKNSPGVKIIGVVKDYHFLSLEKKIEPMILLLNSSRNHVSTMMVKITAGNVPGKIDELRKTWNALNPDKPFDYTFLDDDVAMQYKQYTRWMSIMGFATGFAVLIACLGLFGLAGINAVNRTKEVGIRKVMGANLTSIFILMNKQYTWLAVIAFAIATPVSWYVMTRWYLSGFEFRITVGWELFAVSMLSGLAIALVTVSYHAIKVSLTNPADTLKYE